MTEPHEHVTPTERTVEAEHVEAVVTDPYAQRRGTVYKLRQAIYLLFGIIEGLIAIRFILRVLGANPEAGFAAFIYGITAPFLAPFVGLFGTYRFNGSVLEWHSLVGILVYALIAWVLAKLVFILLGETRSAAATHTTSVDTEVR
jgi:hypothetical protein